MKIDLGETEGTDIDLAPLIDCVFLLLIFFMVSTTFRKSAQADDALFELFLRLPVATAATRTTPSDAALVTTIPAAVEIISAGTWATNPSPTVSKV